AILSAHTTDFASWDNQEIAADRGFRNLVFPCQPSTGTKVYAVYSTGGGIGLRWTDDGGATWNDINKTAVAVQGERAAFDDPTCAAEGNEVWVTYGDSDQGFDQTNSPPLNQIRIAHSPDGGKSIDGRY